MRRGRVTNRYGGKQASTRTHRTSSVRTSRVGAIVAGLPRRRARPRRRTARGTTRNRIPRSWVPRRSSGSSTSSRWALACSCADPPCLYTDPWRTTFAARRSTILSGTPRITYYYTRSRHEYFQVPRVQHVEALRSAEPKASASWLTAADGAARWRSSPRSTCSSSAARCTHHMSPRDRTCEEPRQARAVRRRRSHVRRPVHAPGDGDPRSAGRRAEPPVLVRPPRTRGRRCGSAMA